MNYAILTDTSWQNKQSITSDLRLKPAKREVQMVLLFAFHVLSLMQVFGMARDGVGCTITDVGSMAAMVTWIGATVASFALLCVMKRKAN